MFLLDDLLLWWPGKGLTWLFREIYEHVIAEWQDPDVIRRQLLELQLLYEMDEITLEEYEKHEAQLLLRLRAARQEEGALVNAEE